MTTQFQAANKAAVFSGREIVACSWMPAIVDIFKNTDVVQTLKEKQLNSFYNCVTVAMSNQVEYRRPLIGY